MNHGAQAGSGLTRKNIDYRYKNDGDNDFDTALEELRPLQDTYDAKTAGE